MGHDRHSLAGRLLRRPLPLARRDRAAETGPGGSAAGAEVTEPNTFGTHEFIRFCRLSEVEPYFAANVGTGSPEEFQQWVEYCNAPAESTTLADERVANGDLEPLGVRYWGVGNESWGCGGKFTPEDYCREYRKFTEWLPEYGVKLFLIASGPNGNDLDWTRRFFAKWADGARHRSTAGPLTITAARPGTLSSSRPTSGTSSLPRPTRWRD